MSVCIHLKYFLFLKLILIKVLTIQNKLFIDYQKSLTLLILNIFILIYDYKSRSSLDSAMLE